MSAQSAWTNWMPLKNSPSLESRVLAELLDGGQAFRWNKNPNATDEWRGIWDEHAVCLRRTSSRTNSPATLEWCTLRKADPDATAAALRAYLALDGATESRLDALPWRSDTHLRRCIHEFPGLRILRQPFGETLLCFLCSATKQIVQIKQMVELLARRHGRELRPGVGLYRLPTWHELAAVPESDLRQCLLGFRARYIHETATFLAANPDWLSETEALPYAAAKERLCSLPGVGEKVADCVLLFGAGRLEAFPVDVWIIKTMARRYGLDGWRPAQIAHFGRTHFGESAGLAQQFLFAWERAEAKR
jgi:N-glycosylase/DNA lyase